MGDRWGIGRIEAFGDGVFAIAITLLILEVSVPESSFDNLWRGILDRWRGGIAHLRVRGDKSPRTRIRALDSSVHHYR